MVIRMKSANKSRSKWKKQKKNESKINDTGENK